jgi:hypothetical protein
MANRYWKGQAVHVSCTFTVNGVATDPTTITLKIKNPVGTIILYTYALAEVIKSATGNYYKDLGTDMDGRWIYVWVGTGTCEAVDEGYFEIDTYFG